MLRARPSAQSSNNNAHSVTELEKKPFITTHASSSVQTGAANSTKQALLACLLCAVWIGVVWGVMALSDFFAYKNVWFGVQKSGDDQFW